MNFVNGHNHVRSRMPPRLPLTSLIDVVFLLLVFFMVTATISARESELNSALQIDRQAAGSPADLLPQIVNVEIIEGRPAFRIGQQIVRQRDDLTALLRQLPKEGGVFIKVSGEVPVAAAAAALQAAKDAGFAKVNYVPAH